MMGMDNEIYKSKDQGDHNLVKISKDQVIVHFSSFKRHLINNKPRIYHCRSAAFCPHA